jgi:hypothetical protein
MTSLPPIYYTLRFPDYATARAACQSLGYWREATNDQPEGPITDGQIIGPNGVRGFSISVIGLDPLITAATYDEKGNELTPAVQLSGYYVNVAGILPAAAAPYQVPYGSAGMRFQE